MHNIALSKIPFVGPVLARNLVSYCGGVQGVFEAHAKELSKVPGVGNTIVEAILGKQYFEEAERELAFVEKHRIQVLCYLDENYPKRLKNFNNSPVVLYYKGNADLNQARTVGIVGTRTPTPHGKAMCEELVEGLKAYNVLIVSGLAYGIDVTAHRKSLELGLETLGVLGHGMSRIYPHQHAGVAQEMVEQGGVMTEFGWATKPDRENFPMRNRIIAAMSDALIVVETADRGGSIITAEIANEYNKDVFAVPGRVKDKFAQGCNRLIKTHKAALIERAGDVAYIMRWQEMDKGSRQAQAQLFAELSPNELRLVELLKNKDALGIDQLSHQAQLSPSNTAAVLLELEFKGLVRSMPGKLFTLA